MKMEDDKKIKVEPIEYETDEIREKTGVDTMFKIDDTRGEVVERLVNNEYKIWKSQTPFLYDLVISHAIEWPSLTVEWLPDWEQLSDRDYSVQKIILGTHSSDCEANYLIIAQVKLPVYGDDMDDAEYGSLDNEDDRTELVSGVRCKIEILQQIDHRGEVNRARYMPQNPFMIATKTCSSEVHIFDYRNHPSKPPIGGVVCNPDFRLRGHSSDGFGLEWSKFKPGTLLSGSDDGKICLWDINATPKNKSLHAMQIFQAHKGHVEDVAWHCSNDQVYGSCGSDRYLHIFDLRCPWYSLPIQSGRAHQSTINSLAFSPYNDWLVATGSADKTLKLFDTRKYISPIHTFSHHNDEVVQVGWSPHSENILASCSADRRLMVWDRSRIGQKQTPEDADDGPPELLFIHGGHTSKITEFSWNPCEEWIVASVADDNMLQVWQMAEHIYDG